MSLLQTYDWPGNIRELGAVIDRAAILGDGDSLELAAALGVAAPVSLRTAAAEPSIGTADFVRRRNKIARSTTRCVRTSKRHYVRLKVELKDRAELPDYSPLIRTRSAPHAEIENQLVGVPRADAQRLTQVALRLARCRQ